MSPCEGHRALVLAQANPDDRKTLAAVRSLARAGLRVTLAGDSFRGRSFHSRHVHERLLLPRPGADLEAFRAALAGLLESGSFGAVLPTSDSITFLLSQHRDELPYPERMLVPEATATAICKDKQRTAEFAAGIGLTTPPTICPADRDELRRAAATLRYPCILKPRVTAGSVGMSSCADAGELLAAWEALPGLVSTSFDFRRPLVQEKIRGEVHEVCALFNRGEPRAALTQRRLLMYPAGGGAGIYNETTDEPGLKRRALRLLEALRWHGPAQVEFIRDAASGEAFLLEVNGRLWGTLDLAVAAGMDFPALACRMAIDGDVEPKWDYRVGLRFRWPFPFGLLYLMETRRWGEAARAFLLPRRGTRSDLSLSDPKPLLMEAWYTLRRYGKRGFRTIRGQQDWSEIVRGDSGRDG